MVNFNMELKKEKENIQLIMIILMMEIGIMIYLLVMENIVLLIILVFSNVLSELEKSQKSLFMKLVQKKILMLKNLKLNLKK